MANIQPVTPLEEKPFELAKWVAGETNGNSSESIEYDYKKKKEFKDICKIIKADLDRVIDIEIGEKNTNKNNEWLDRQHNAITGNEAAIHYFIEEIQKSLRKFNITSEEYPPYHKSLAEAIFHEIWGGSILAKWEQYPDSEACAIRGTELWIDIDGTFVQQTEEFEDHAVVNRIKRAFVIRREDSVINRENPELEIQREDGSRISMIQPPRSEDEYIMLRRFIINKFSLDEQASKGTIPFEDIGIYRALSRTMCNMIIAGRVRSAKSTFMKTLIGERSNKYVGAVLEKHFELGLRKHFPDRLFWELQAKEGDLHTAIPRLLRLEHDYVVVGEIRSLEIEGYLLSTERGERGSLSTYHLTDENRVVEQLTRHTLDEFPTRRFSVEIERVATNIDIIITMGTDRDRLKKRVVGVTEVIWNPETRTHEIVPILRYSSLKDKYYYDSKISKRLLFLMAKENLEETKILVKMLSEREKTAPMSSYETAEDLEELLFEGIDK
ncbi:ATPase, T2SS/T4P/T4SS family [Peribacillus loiseleuriae]|uniref:ATPase, T2SS/T4P/T4SS family n=1 Tax=Peribacillus loiseleuriae TaxID=1679170 RepID=UPI003CFE7122